MSETAGEGRRVAIVGAGPSGFYAAEQLLAKGFEVDLLDLLPTPFGLVRAGVAPDHPKIKSVTRMYEKTARARRLPLLRRRRGRRRHQPRGAAAPATTPSSTRSGRRRTTGSASPARTAPAPTPPRDFVAWYNGHPHACDEEFDLSATRAVVVGNGNVAIDIARMLVLDPDELAPTDTADHALAALAAAQVEEVVLLGRRGPAQAAFTNPELRELGELSRAAPVIEPGELELDEHSRALAGDRGRPDRQAQLRAAARPTPSGRSATRATASRCASCARPVELLGDGEDGHVTGMRIVHNRIEPARGRQPARGRHRPRGGHPLRAGDPLDRLSRHAARRRALRPAPRPDPQHGRPRVRRGRRAACPASTSSAGSSAARAA